MAITPLPPPPEPTDSTAQFNAKAFAWVAAIDNWTDEANATATAVNASQSAAAGSALGAANSATQAANQVTLAAAQATQAGTFANTALTHAQSAAAATNAPLWVTGATYAVGALVYSLVNGRIYRSKSAFTSTVNPASDPTNWVEMLQVVDQTDIGTAPNEIPLNQYLGSMAYLDADNISFTATGTNTPEQNLAYNKLTTVVISADTTLTTTVPKVGASAYVIVITSGTTSRTVTFGTGFKSTGTLATGTSADRRFVFHFISDGANLVEVSRTAAITY
jgi:hypothetical protein